MNQVTVCANPNPLKGEVSFEQRQKMIEQEMEAEKKRKKIEKQSPYTRWTQFNNDATSEMIALTKKNPPAMALLLFLVDQMDQYNAVVCSMQVLTEALGYSRRTLSNSVKFLKDNGFIAVFKSGTSNVYTINDKVWWKSWGNNLKYSKFPANVVLAHSEQMDGEDYKVDAEKVRMIKEIKKKKERN